MTNRRKSVADQLRKAIAKAERKGMSRREIARLAGVSTPIVTLIMTNPDRHIRLDTAEKLAGALGKRLRLDD